MSDTREFEYWERYAKKMVEAGAAGFVAWDRLSDSRKFWYVTYARGVVQAVRKDTLDEVERMIRREYTSDEPINEQFIHDSESFEGLDSERIFGESVCFHLRELRKREVPNED